MKIFLCLSLLLAIALAVRVDRKILEDSENGRFASFSIHLKSKADLSPAKHIKEQDVGMFVYASLKLHAQSTQQSILSFLSGRDDVRSITPFYIANFIIVEGQRSLIDVLKNRDDIKALNSNRPFKVPLEQAEETFATLEDANEWNVEYVFAHSVWEQYGTTGQNTTYANADTGVDWTHPALSPNYRGNQGGVNHNFNWWDGVKTNALPGQGTCGVNSQVPCDDNSHGTHTTGTAVGQGGIGVAPGAQWIGCRNMDRGFGTVSSYMSCLQFFLAPHDLQGSNANPDLRPHSIGNSYGCVASEGCQGDEFKESVEALRAANVFMSVSAGNSGPSCGSIGDPPATEPSVISVGATGTRSDAIAAYSSRGPLEGGTIKPDVVAPGSGVRSSVPGGGYASFSGTSMASPHVAGAVQLLVSVCRTIQRNVDELEKVLEDTAKPLYTTLGCGSDTPSSSPNNVYGHGLINILAAAAQCAKAERN